MFVEGNPAPTFKFFKGTQEIIEGGRYKLISDGDNNNMIMMAIAKVKAADESEYRVEIENCHGSDEANFMLFVSGYFHVFLSSYFFLFFLSSKEVFIRQCLAFNIAGNKLLCSLLLYAFSYLNFSIIDPTALSSFYSERLPSFDEYCLARCAHFCIFTVQLSHRKSIYAPEV